LDKELAGEIIQRLFNAEEEVDLDHAEVKRIMGVKPEASPYAHLAKVYAIEANHVEGTSLPTLLTVNFRQPRVLVIHWFRL
jgi:hypothetical protein